MTNASNRMRGDGGWLDSAAEVALEGHKEPLPRELGELIARHGFSQVLDVLECVAVAAHDHLEAMTESDWHSMVTEVSPNDVSLGDARANVDDVREHLRLAQGVL